MLQFGFVPHTEFTLRGKRYRIWRGTQTSISTIVASGPHAGSNHYLRPGSSNYNRILKAWIELERSERRHNSAEGAP